MDQLVFEMKGKFLDDRIGEDFAGNALNLGTGCSGIELAPKLYDKVFALTDIFDSLVLHLHQCVVNSLSLRIEDSLLECYVDMSLHRNRLYKL
jgi:hypothetical protein